MKRLTANQKETIISGINNGVSIKKLAKEMDLAKSTIYYYYKKIKGKRYKAPHYEVAFSEIEGEIVGIFAGDGSQCYSKNEGHYINVVHFGNYDYMIYVKGLFEKYFNRNFSIVTIPSVCIRWKTRYRIIAYDKKIFNYFYSYIEYERTHKHDTVKLNSLDLPDSFKIGFLRGFVDTDGWVGLRHGKHAVVFYTTSQSLAEQIQIMLNELKLHCGVYIRYKEHYKPLYHIQLRAGSVDRFLSIVQPFKAKKKGW